MGFPARVSDVQRVWSNNLIRARRNAATNSPQDLPRANLVFCVSKNAKRIATNGFPRLAET